MKKSIFSKIGDKIRNKPNEKSNITKQIRGNQTMRAKDDGSITDEKTIDAKLEEECKQALSEEVISQSKNEEINKKDNTLSKDMSLSEEKTDLNSDNKFEESVDEERTSKDSEICLESDIQIKTEAEDEELKSDDIDFKKSENFEKNELDNVDDQVLNAEGQSSDIVQESSGVLNEFANNKAIDDFASNQDEDKGLQEVSYVTESIDSNADTEKTNDVQADVISDLNRKVDDANDIDVKPEKDMTLEEDDKKEVEQITDYDIDTSELSDESKKGADFSGKSDDITDESQEIDNILDTIEESDAKVRVKEKIESIEDLAEDIEKKSKVTSEVTDNCFDKSEETDDTIEADPNDEIETSKDIESDIFQTEADTKADESTAEDNEIDQIQKDVDRQSADLISVDEAISVDEKADSDDLTHDVILTKSKSEKEILDEVESKENESVKTADDKLDKKTDSSDTEDEKDILSEVASSREADSVSRENNIKEDISEPTEELPVITGAMLGAKAMFSDREDNDEEHNVSPSKEENTELSEAEPESVLKNESDETEKEGLSKDSSSEGTDHTEDVADFFVFPDNPDKKDIPSEHSDNAVKPTDAMPVSKFTDTADHQDQSAKTGKVIDLSESDEKADTQDKAENPKEKGPQKPKKQKKGAIVFGILAAIVGVLVACYVGGVFFYQNHFFFGTQISGVNASNKTVEEVEKSIKKDAKDYKLTLKEREDQSEIITANDINLRYSDNNPVQAAMQKQNTFKWPLALLGVNDDELPTVYEYDEAKLNAKIQSLNAISAMVNAENAHPVYSNGQIIIKGMIQGNEVDPKALTSAVKKAIAKGDETVDLEANKVYKNPTYGEDAKEVESAKKVMEGYLKSEITYTIGEAKEVLDKDDFGPWLMTDEAMNVYIDQEQAASWIHENLGAKYDTAWGDHEFKNSAGQQMIVSGGNYGWEIDEEVELGQLMTLIPAGQKNSHEPAWARTALTGKGTHADIGNTYIEISLGSQHMWCYKDGKLVIDTDVVTGDVNRGRGTPSGVFYIYGMQENATLVGEDYRTPVAYWMPFNGGVGIHDSTWRGASEYGGSTYMGNGSHGCVNTPLDVVAVIFQNADVGEPVVVY